MKSLSLTVQKFWRRLKLTIDRQINRQDKNNMRPEKIRAHKNSNRKKLNAQGLYRKVSYNFHCKSLRRRFYKQATKFSLIPNYLPLNEGVVLHLNKLESPSLKDALWQVWLKLA